MGLADWVRALYLSLVGSRAFCNRSSMKVGVQKSWVPNIPKVDRRMHLDREIGWTAIRLAKCS